jgi:hypothetical protein
MVHYGQFLWPSLLFSALSQNMSGLGFLFVRVLQTFNTLAAYTGRQERKWHDQLSAVLIQPLTDVYVIERRGASRVPVPYLHT